MPCSFVTMTLPARPTTASSAARYCVACSIPRLGSTSGPAGVGYVTATDAVALDIDTRGVDVHWTENATADSFGKNLVFARCESWYTTAVFSPLGVVSLDLTP